MIVAVGDALAPAFTALARPADAARAGEWIARVLRSYVLMPEPTIDLTDDTTAREFLGELVVPGIRPSAQPEELMADHTDIPTSGSSAGRRQRPRRDPLDHQPRRRRGRAHGPRRRPTPSSRGTTSAAAPALGKLYEKAKTSQWNANDLPWDIEVDQEEVAETNQNQNGVRPQRRLHRHAVREVGRQGVDPVRHRDPELDAVAVHARRAGRARSAPRRSSRRCRGSTPSTTPPPR